MSRRSAPLPAFLLLAASLCAAPRAPGGTGVAAKLASRGRLAVPLEEARALESRLGQMLIVNVDGFGVGGPLALHPGFIDMVERLQVGGVIPHYGTTDFQRIRRTNRALARMTHESLLIACDIVKLSAPGQAGARGRTARFGDGYVGGFIGRFRALPDDQFAVLARLNAFVFSALGMNVALGPTVDDSTRDPRTAERARLVTGELRRFSLLPVLKHFPFLPAAANLHRQSPDTKVALRIAEQRAGIFRTLSRESEVLMTTHLLDSLVDSDIVTFSPAWNRILRRVTGFDGLLMSDGLLMLSSYVKPDDPVQWAQRAVLAGHDFLIVEGSAAVTWRVFEGLLEAACRDDEAARALRGRIRESTARIGRFKKANARILRREADVPAAALSAAVALAPAEGTEPAAWRVDAPGFEALEPALRAPGGR